MSSALPDAAPFSLPRPLAPAPPRLIDDGGVPVEGTWAGTPGETGFNRLAAPYARNFFERRLVEKRWQYALVTTREAMLAIAIIDLGYLSSGIAAIFDRGARRLLLDENPILPPGCASVSDEPGVGLCARLIGPGVRARIERNGDRIDIEAAWGRGHVEVSLDAATALPPLSVLSPLGPGRFNFTRKLTGLSAQGSMRVGSTTFSVDGGCAGLDFTHGFLERETAWRWAFASGRTAKGQRVAFNFSEGFIDAGLGENVVWVDGAPLAVGPVTFSFDQADPAQPWTVSADGGAAELRFTPEGQRAQNTDLKLVASRYIQPFGTFDGFVLTEAGERVQVSGLAGVTEDHRARW